MKIDPQAFQIMPSEACKQLLDRLKKQDPNITQRLLDWTEFVFMSGASQMWDIHTIGMVAFSNEESMNFMDRVQADLQKFAGDKVKQMRPESN